MYGDEKVAVENQEHELIFADNAVFYIADSDRGVWTNEGTYTYDPPKIVLKVTEVDPAAGTVEGDVLTVGAFASMDVVIPMEFKKQ